MNTIQKMSVIKRMIGAMLFVLVLFSTTPMSLPADSVMTFCVECENRRCSRAVSDGRATCIQNAGGCIATGTCTAEYIITK